MHHTRNQPRGFPADFLAAFDRPRSPAVLGAVQRGWSDLQALQAAARVQFGIKPKRAEPAASGSSRAETQHRLRMVALAGAIMKPVSAGQAAKAAKAASDRDRARNNQRARQVSK